MADRRPRLRDVAERAGVSIGTASNAFNRPEMLSEALRDRVAKAARELGYSGPDPAGGRPRPRRAGAIGLVFTEDLLYAFGDAAQIAFMRGVAAGVESSGAGLLIIPARPGRGEAANIVRQAVVDGFIVYSSPDDDPRYLAALDRGLPVVTVDQPLDPPTAFVGIDDRGGARAAARHLRDLGHERVAILSFAETADDAGELPFGVTRERLEGYREGLGDAWDESRVERVYPKEAPAARAAMLRALAHDPPPTAALAMSDTIAAGALEAAAEQGLAVPGALSVVGYDDSATALRTTPQLTTVAQPTEDKGRLAAEALLAALRGEEPEPRTLLPTELIVRGSTSPPAG